MYDIIISYICTFLLYKGKTKSAYFLSSNLCANLTEDDLLITLWWKNKQTSIFFLF